MNDNQLLMGESIITQSNDNQITLTTHRIRYNDSAFGKAKIVSMMLENVSSIEVHYKSWPFVLNLAILAALIGIGTNITGMQNQKSDLQSIGFIQLAVAAVLFLIYFFNRKHIVSIASNGGGRIDFFTKGLSRESIIDFVDKIEAAKHKRVSALKPSPAPAF